MSNLRNDALVAIGRVGSHQHAGRDARQTEVAKATALVYIGDQINLLAYAIAHRSGAITAAEFNTRMEAERG
jgi:hypothetical protein